MKLENEVDFQSELVGRITSVARRSSCSLFADICWAPFPASVLDLLDHPGVMMETQMRIVVFQRIERTLRYYAGGWCCGDEQRIINEQDRVNAEGHESGVFPSVVTALTFAERYLVQEAEFSDISVSRERLFWEYPKDDFTSTPETP